MSQANRALCYLSVMVGQCVAQSGTKRFCEEATKQKVELGTEQNRTEQKAKSSNVGWGLRVGGAGRGARSLDHMLIVGCKQRLERQAHARSGDRVAISETF